MLGKKDLLRPAQKLFWVCLMQGEMKQLSSEISCSLSLSVRGLNNTLLYSFIERNVGKVTPRWPLVSNLNPQCLLDIQDGRAFYCRERMLFRADLQYIVSSAMAGDVYDSRVNGQTCQNSGSRMKV